LPTNLYLSITLNNQNQITRVNLSLTPPAVTLHPPTNQIQKLCHAIKTTANNPFAQNTALTDYPWNLLDTSKLSSFQIKVYQALVQIPQGTTLSYSQLASKIHQPQAARAIGNALAKNPFPYLLPCHRVIKHTGELGNFSAGPDIKQLLLTTEKNPAQRPIKAIAVIITPPTII
jgi:O-6-methylguanine DNA methyltransferase